MNCIKKRGFTLVELIVVIAILAALAALAMPTFSGLVEKTNRLVDVSNAKTIQRVMTIKAIDGSIKPNSSAASTSGNGFWILVVRDNNSFPTYYNSGKFKNSPTVYCGADTGVTVDGVKNSNWSEENAGLVKLFNENFGNKNIKCKSHFSKKVDGIEGWDWYIVEFYWKNGNLESTIYSGKQGSDAGLKTGAGSTQTNIQKFMGVDNPK